MPVPSFGLCLARSPLRKHTTAARSRIVSTAFLKRSVSRALGPLSQTPASCNPIRTDPYPFRLSCGSVVLVAIAG